MYLLPEGKTESHTLPRTQNSAPQMVTACSDNCENDAKEGFSGRRVFGRFSTIWVNAWGAKLRAPDRRWGRWNETVNLDPLRFVPRCGVRGLQLDVLR